MRMSNRRWFSAKELSEYFSMPRKSILRYAATGRFPSGSVIRIGKHWRFDVRGIEEEFQHVRSRDVAIKGRGSDCGRP